MGGEGRIGFFREKFNGVSITRRRKQNEKEKERQKKKRIVGNSLRPLNVRSISMKLLREPICLLDRINAIGFEYRNAGTLTVDLIKFSSTVNIRPFSFHRDFLIHLLSSMVNVPFAKNNYFREE